MAVILDILSACAGGSHVPASRLRAFPPPIRPTFLQFLPCLLLSTHARSSWRDGDAQCPRTPLTNAQTFNLLLSTGPLADISNLSAANLQKKRAREKYASLSIGQKADIVRKNRENRQRRSEQSKNINLTSSPTVYKIMLFKMQPPHSDISSLSAAEIKRKRARERYASLSPGRKEARNKKARESRKRKNESSQNM
uniref:Uncharacterized protein n=1 Tax=Oryza meridionalis TaxID=40149 RepID=A0A0E0DHL2_9ORYZ